MATGFRFAGFELDTGRELLIGPEGPIALRRQTYRLLLLLVERAPDLVSRDELMDALWGHHALSPNVVPQTLSELRQALGDDAQQPRFIETRHRRGYAFIAVVERIETLDATPAKAGAGAIAGATDDTDERPPDADRPAAVAAVTPGARWIMRRSVPLLSAFLLLVLLVGGLLTRDRLPLPSPDRPYPVLAIDFDPASAATAALLDLRLRSGGGIVLAAGHSPLRDAGGALKPWLLELAAVDQQLTWSLHDPAGNKMSRGVAAPEAPVRAAADIEAALRSGLRAPASQVLIGWPNDSAALERLAAGAEALQAGAIDGAIAELSRALRDVEGLGWPQLQLARAHLHGGDWTAAQAVLGDAPLAISAHNDPDRFLIEALRGDLRGAPEEASAALRAYLHLIPEDIDVALQLFERQLRLRHWDAATTSLNEIASRLQAEAPDTLALWQARLASEQGQTGAALSRLSAYPLPEDARPITLMQRSIIQLRAENLHRQGQAAGAIELLQPLASDATPELALALARMAREQGSLAIAEQALTAAEQGFAQLGRKGDARRVRLERAVLELDRSGAPRARADLLSLLTEAEAAGEPRLLGDIHSTLSIAHSAVGDTTAARVSLQAAVAAAERSGDVSRQAAAHLNHGVMLAQQRRNEEAEAAFSRAAESFRHSADPRGEAMAMANLASLAARAGRHQQAREAYQIALQRQRQLGVATEVARIAFNLGVLTREQGALDDAAAHFKEASDAALKADAADLALQIAASSAELELLRGRADLARERLESVAVYADRGSPMRRAAVYAADARIHEVAADWAGAHQRYRQARALREEAGAPAWVLATDLRLLRVALHETSERGRLRVHLEDLEAEFTRLGEVGDALSVGLTQAEAALADADRSTAEALLARLRPELQTRGSRLQQHQAAWLTSLLATGEERDERLLRLITVGDQEGFRLLSLLAGDARGAAKSLPTASADQLRGDLAGVLATPSAAF